MSDWPASSSRRRRACLFETRAGLRRVSGIWAVVPVKEWRAPNNGCRRPNTEGTSPARDDHARGCARRGERNQGACRPARRHASTLPHIARRPLWRGFVQDGARNGHTGAVTAASRVLAREGRIGMMTIPATFRACRQPRSPRRWRRTRPRRLSPSCPRMTISAQTRSSARRPTPFPCVSARTVSTRISIRRESRGSSRSSSAIPGSAWISTIPSTSSCS